LQSIVRLQTTPTSAATSTNPEFVICFFGKAKSTTNEHIKNIYAEDELEEGVTRQSISGILPSNLRNLKFLF